MMTNMGILPEFFFPKTAGQAYESTPYLDILAEHRADMTVFSGVSLPGVDGGHAAEKSFLTGAPEPVAAASEIASRLTRSWPKKWVETRVWPRLL